MIEGFYFFSGRAMDSGTAVYAKNRKTSGLIGRLNLVSHPFCILLIVHFCMKDYSTPFLTRFSRLFKMLLWLFSTVRRIRRLDKASVEQRNAEFSSICAEALSILNVRLIAMNRPSESLKGVLVVANHISLLDIFAITALCPSSFIAMKELSRWPVIGRVARNADTVFIDRSNRKDINIINEAICRSLTEGKNVCFFPEARTSSGNGILPFKAALFQSAIDAGSEIQPLALRYFDSQKRRTTQPSFSEVNLFVSLWRIVSMQEIEVHVDFLPLEKPQGDRYEVKDKIEAAIGREVGKIYEVLAE